MSFSRLLVRSLPRASVAFRFRTGLAGSCVPRQPAAFRHFATDERKQVVGEERQEAVVEDDEEDEEDEEDDEDGRRVLCFQRINAGWEMCAPQKFVLFSAGMNTIMLAWQT